MVKLNKGFLCESKEVECLEESRDEFLDVFERGREMKYTSRCAWDETEKAHK